jgi:hypothetical protein
MQRRHLAAKLVVESLQILGEAAKFLGIDNGFGHAAALGKAGGRICLS